MEGASRVEFRRLLAGRAAPIRRDRTPGHPAGADAFWSALPSLAPPDPPEASPLAYAPAALTSGACLAEVFLPGRSEGELGAACLAAFDRIAGQGDVHLHDASLYRAALAAKGVALADAAELPADRRLTDADFAHSVAGLTLAGSPDDALGFHAASVAFGAPSAVVRALEGSLWASKNGAANPVATEALERCLRAFEGNWASLWRGAQTFAEARRTWAASLAAPPPSPWERMIDLVRAKARRAFGSHRDVRVGGRSLDTFLEPLDPVGLLEHLATSQWIVPGDPDRSSLVVRSVAFGGSMFGVFTAEDVEVLRAWIAALPSRAPMGRDGAPELALRPTAAVPARHVVEVHEPAPPYLYHRLLSRQNDETDGLAGRYVTRLLGAVDHERPPLPWCADGLARWVDERLREEANPPEIGVERELGKDEVVWALTQLAPAAFVDGAWLAGAPKRAASPASSLLYRIYRDEIGAGVPRQHHGNVLRRALEEAGVALPPCVERAFVWSPALLPEAFVQPNLWLAIARHHDAFLPELLGLNLAIEMAGVGRTYARAIALLRRHGIDPYFFQLHDSIDNGASGHTAWSVEAIVHHVSAHPEDWSRVWKGHALYARSSRPLIRAVLARLGPRLGWRWLRRKLRS